MTPAFKSACTSICTDLTSRSSLRASSRVPTGPLAIIICNIRQRLGVSTRCITSSDGKLICEPCRSPRKAALKRADISPREATPILTVFISALPGVNIGPKVGEQLVDRREGVGGFFAADVPMVALAGLVVVADHANAVHDESQPIFEVMQRAR